MIAVMFSPSRSRPKFRAITGHTMNSLLRWICIALPAALSAAPALAQPAYPTKPVRFLVGAPAGGSNDIFARALSQRLSEALGQPVIVDNRPGASQMIAADLTAQ